ncbi:MAG TPA: glycosyltransferase family 2 protein [Gemmatimonadaceae bacterium]|nr:glycosyltransferase family 2 protein [Gemmatimonadaceae bacterium]
MLRISLGLVLVFCTVLLWLPMLSEALCLLLRRRQSVQPLPAVRPRILFVVPAHDEELMIQDCVRSLLAMDYPADARRLVVVADNCSDATARLVRELGVECMERIDPQFPGKPRAIAWALTAVDLTKWDACVVVDADSVVARDFALGLARLAPLNDIVFQPNNLVVNEFETWLTRLGGLLGRCRFEVTFPLKEAAGLNFPIGNGMGIGTSLLLRDGWRSYSIAEDSALYAIYTESGTPIRLARHANIYSQESRSLGEGATQRRRWLGGRIQILREMAATILRSPNIGLRQKLDIFIELGLTSPVLNLMIALGVVALALIGVGGFAGRLIAAAAALSLTGIVLTTLVAIARHPQPGRTLLAFVMLPTYALWRFFVFVSTVLTLNDTTWRRSSRSPAPAPLAHPQS